MVVDDRRRSTSLTTLPGWLKAWTLASSRLAFLAMGLGLPTGPVALAQEVPFGAPSTLPLGRTSRSVVLGDLDGDGALDAAVLSTFAQERTISVLLGTGNGSFGPPANFPVGVNSHALTLADFNLDGNLDLAVTGSSPESGNAAISILSGDGAGSFATARTVEFAGTPTSTAIGDFNQDGRPDLAMANLTRPTDGEFVMGVAILLGDGDGSFASASNAAVAQDPTPFSGDVVVGDFNGDGKLDAAVGSSFVGSTFVLPGDGTGGFGAALQSPGSGGGLGGLVARDFDQDGKLDLVARGTAVQFFRGDGAGTFAGPLSSVENTGVGPMVASDLNQDGKEDLVLGGNGTCCVSVVLGTGAGGFGSRTDFAFGIHGTGVTSVAIGDLNGDGKSDLVAVNEYNDLLAVFLNTPVNQPPNVGAFSFTPTLMDPFFGHFVLQAFPLTITFGVTGSDPDGTIEEARWDFNGDGVTDRVTTTLSTSFTYSNVESFGADGGLRVTVTVVDNAGGTTAAVTTAPLLTRQQLISRVGALISAFVASGDISNQGVAQSLSASLNNASRALTLENTVAAQMVLQVERDKLNTYVQHGQITPMVRDTLAPLIDALLASL